MRQGFVLLAIAAASGLGGCHKPVDPCAGRVPHCSDDGSEVLACQDGIDEPIQICPTDTVCDGAMCKRFVCTAGLGFCDRGVADQCNALGTVETRTDCGALMQACVNDAMGARCVAQACAPNQLFCSSDGTQVLKCDSDGQGSSVYQTCSDPDQRGNQCSGGQCVDRCAVALGDPGALGCGFWAAPLTSSTIAILVDNPQPDLPAKVTAQDLAGHTQTIVVAPSSTGMLALPGTGAEATGVSAVGQQVTSTVPIYAWQIAAGGDGARLVPEAWLGAKAVAAADESAGDGFVAVVGTQPQTAVQIQLTAPTQAGGPLPAYAAGDVAQATVGRGQLLYLRASGPGLSGSRVDASAPVVVLAGTAGAHTEAEMLPWATLGTSYGAPDGNVVVVAREDGTNVTAGGQTTPLAAGGAITLTGPVAVSSDRAVAVVCRRPGGGLVALSPREQWLGQGAIAALPGAGTIVVTARDAGYMFDGMAVTGAVIDGAFSDAEFARGAGVWSQSGSPAALYALGGGALALSGPLALEPIHP